VHHRRAIHNSYARDTTGVFRQGRSKAHRLAGRCDSRRRGFYCGRTRHHRQPGPSRGRRANPRRDGPLLRLGAARTA
jgi:hypothetical protein